MRLIGITNQGLAAIALLVAILWGCIVVERSIRRQAWEETVQVLRTGGPVRIRAPYPAPKRAPPTPAVKPLRAQLDLKV